MLLLIRCCCYGSLFNILNRAAVFIEHIIPCGGYLISSAYSLFYCHLFIPYMGRIIMMSIVRLAGQETISGLFCPHPYIYGYGQH